MTTSRFRHLRAWNRLMHSTDVNWNVDRAEREHAPENAIYRDSDGKWVTADAITSPETADSLARLMEQFA